MTTNVYYRQGLTGGGSTDLDAIDGDLLNDGDAAIVFNGNTFYPYLLDATSGAAESSPDIIAPDTNPGNKRWILQDASVEKGIATTKNLVVKPNASNPNTQIDIIADAVVLVNDSNEVLVKTGISVTVDISTSGKNGRGDSITESADTWYTVFLGWDGSAVYGWFDDDVNGDGDPDGTNSYQALVSVVLNNSSSNISDFDQKGNRWDHQARFETATGLSSTTYATQDVSSGVPSALGLVRDALFGGIRTPGSSGSGTIEVSYDGVNKATTIGINSNNNGIGDDNEIYNPGNGVPLFIPLDGNNIHYKVSANAATLYSLAFHLNLPLG